MTFAFGLIHGLGFASVLREIGVRSMAAGVALPLFSFNLGVEPGRWRLPACVLPIALRLKTARHLSRLVMPVFSVVIALAGVY